MIPRRKKLRDMSCNELVELVTEYLEGEMSPADRSRFEQHLNKCDGCRNYLDQMQETISALGRIPPESLTPEAEHRLLKAFRDWRYARP
jgi:predicted anti-sigma-YlaC factor YlaD